MPDYPKRLIEVDLPIKRISAHARREKSIRHGHISTLHIWWARRPLAACRAVICAALWPDPADPNCPQAFRDAAARLVTEFANKVVGKGKIEGQRLIETCSPESLGRWEGIVNSGIPLDPTDQAHQNVLRFALLDFVADFANWDNSTVPAYLETARALTQAAHEALGGEPGTRPLVVDPFAGGGSIPLEVLRVGADAFASDLNPVAVLLNKVVVEYIPKHGQGLADEVRKWGQWVKEQAEEELAAFYPKDPDGATPIAYLWARTVKCEGPGCGAEIPLMQSFWVERKPGRSTAIFAQVPEGATASVLSHKQNPPVESVHPATVKRGSATCIFCGYTTPVASVRQQLRSRRGGSRDARLTTVVVATRNGASYRAPVRTDINAIRRAEEMVSALDQTLLPDEPTPDNSGHRAVGSPHIYGMTQWRDLFSPRQILVLGTIARLVRDLPCMELQTGVAVRCCLALAVDKVADYMSTLSTWRVQRSCVRGTFGRQALAFAWDFGEMNPFAGSAADFAETSEFVAKVIDELSRSVGTHGGVAACADATRVGLPDDAAHLLLTDPPYYDSVPFAEIADFFYVWLKRMLHDDIPELTHDLLTPKLQQAIVWHPGSVPESDEYVRKMTETMREARRAVCPSGLGVVFFAHKSTAGWESQLAAMIEAGWTITGSWPIDTERGGRFNSQGAATLASSVQLVCRPRENAAGVPRSDVGDWRDVLTELPGRIHEWMPRLAEEGVVGADAIFACLGPALEIFSRYNSVEKSSGETVPLADYLAEVWAAVSNEALSMIFRDADAAGLEPDARLTAMWLWTLGAGQPTPNGNGKPFVAKATAVSVGVTVQSPDAAEDEPTEPPEIEDGSDDPDDAAGAKKPKVAGYVLEFDAARKIAQGLGVHLDKIESVVEVKGDKARLLPVAERTRYLFGKDNSETMKASGRGKGKKKAKQQNMFEELGDVEAAESRWAGLKGPLPGATSLDRLHQTMILFGAGRGELMKRFLVDEGVGSDARFWKLAQSLSALYPGGTDEKRWVDGVLARKKGLGF